MQVIKKSQRLDYSWSCRVWKRSSRKLCHTNWRNITMRQLMLWSGVLKHILLKQIGGRWTIVQHPQFSCFPLYDRDSIIVKIYNIFIQNPTYAHETIQLTLSSSYINLIDKWIQNNTITFLDNNGLPRPKSVEATNFQSTSSLMTPQSSILKLVN